MTKEELEKFEVECKEFFDKCEKFAETFNWKPCSEWTRFEVPFFDFVGLIEFSKEYTKCPNCKKFSSAEDWAEPNKCDWC